LLQHLMETLESADLQELRHLVSRLTVDAQRLKHRVIRCSYILLLQYGIILAVSE